MWVKFIDKLPKLRQYVIVRDAGYDAKGIRLGDCFHDYRQWEKEILNHKPSPTHWWDGEPNFKLAVESWKNGKDKTT